MSNAPAQLRSIRVERAVREQARDACHATPKQGRDNGVRGVFGDRLRSRAGQFHGVESGRVAGTQMRKPPPGTGEITVNVTPTTAFALGTTTYNLLSFGTLTGSLTDF